jgi:hypothetical protein
MVLRKVLLKNKDSRSLFNGDVIEYKEMLWLVPEWLHGPTKGTLVPARIISLDGMPVRAAGPQHRGVDFLLSTPLSTELLDGRKESQNPLVIEGPTNIILNADTDFRR